MGDANAGYVVVSSHPRAGKTVLAGAMARRFRKQGRRVGVFIPVAFNCQHRAREGLISEDAEFLAHCADCEAQMDQVCPVRYHELVLPGTYSTYRQSQVDLQFVMETYQALRGDHELMIVEAPAGIYHPLSDTEQVIDLLTKLALPAVVIAPAKCEAISTLIMTIKCLRSEGLSVVAAALNQYDPLQASGSEEVSPEAVARLADVPLPVMIPPDPDVDVSRGRLGQDVIFAVNQIRF